MSKSALWYSEIAFPKEATKELADKQAIFVCLIYLYGGKNQNSEMNSFVSRQIS